MSSLHFSDLPLSQIRGIDTNVPIPLTCRHLKLEEERVLGDMKMRVLDMTSDPTVPFTKDNVCMIAPEQQLSCITYDLWDTLQDLLNDGEHATNAHFTYSANRLKHFKSFVWRAVDCGLVENGTRQIRRIREDHGTHFLR